MQPVTIVIIFIAIFLAISLVFVTYFLIRVAVWLNQKNQKALFDISGKRKSIYERLGEDENATRYYIYMRRKMIGG